MSNSYKEYASKEYVNEAVENIEVEIPAQDTEPEEGNVWIDTSEDGATIDTYTKAETDAKIDEKISAAFANIAHAEGGSF